LITEETAMLYSVNKPTMRQRLDLARGRGNRASQPMPAVPMMVIAAAAHPEPAVVAPPLVAPMAKPEPHPGLFKGILNGLI
jgi:hypothetical protein